MPPNSRPHLRDGSVSPRGKWTPKRPVAKAPPRPVRAPREHEKRAEWYATLGRCPIDCTGCYGGGWTIELPGVRLVSEMNSREHWAARNSRKQTQQRAVYRAIQSGPSLRPRLPVTVTITRTGPRKFDPDAVSASMKHVQDEVARLLGCDDGDENSVTWVYVQAKGAYGVRVVIQPRDAAKGAVAG